MYVMIAALILPNGKVNAVNVQHGILLQRLDYLVQKKLLLIDTPVLRVPQIAQ